ncbi:MAG: hypothetical protein GY903_22810 [Fuerstiella sp.]|nr:hypothetical protein [Fuerstiella sp.]MCP4857324.1 hypothetical protein [Fuerstiella sp.]
MRLVDPGPLPPFDASAFATYDNEQDAAPLASELVEDLPEKPTAVGADEVSAESRPVERPPFRGKGYLRAEAPPETDDTDSGRQPGQAEAGRSQSPHQSDSQSAQLPVGQKPDEEDATGAEIQTSPTVAADVSIKAGTAAPGNGDAGNTDETSRRKRRRKPRRRRKTSGNPENKGETVTPPISQTNVNGDQATSSIESGDQPLQSTADSSSDSPTSTADDKANSNKPTGRRRRRRSRNRGRGKSDGAS